MKTEAPVKVKRRPAKVSVFSLTPAEQVALTKEYVESKKVSALSLAKKYNLTPKSIQIFEVKANWRVRREEYRKQLRSEAKEYLPEQKDKLLNMVASEFEESKPTQTSAHQKKVQQIEEDNEEIIKYSRRLIKMLALGMGVTDADFQLAEEDPDSLTEQMKKMIDDKEANANFTRLIDKFREIVITKRLVEGQSTSAASAPPITDDTEIERMVVRRAAHVEPEIK